MKTNTLTKWSFSFFMLIALTFFMTGCENGDNRKSFWEAPEYNDYLIAELHKIDDFYSNGMTSAKDSVSALQFCSDLEKETKITLENLNIQPFEGDSSMCEVMKEFVNHLNSISTKELKEFFTLLYTKNRTKEDQPRIDELSKIIDGEKSRIWTKIGVQQNLFATRNNIQLR